MKWKLHSNGVYIGVIWGYIGIMENKMETTISGLGSLLVWGYVGVILYWYNGK